MRCRSVRRQAVAADVADHTVAVAPTRRAHDPRAVVEQRHGCAVRQARHHHGQQTMHAGAHVEQAAQLMAELRQERRAARRLLGHRQRRFSSRVRHARIGLARDAPLQHLQLDEHAHLGAQHLGHHRRQDVVDRAERVAARGLDLVGVGGDEDDRRVGAALVAPDQRGGLEAVDVGHVDIEQDHRELAGQHLAQRLGARTHEHEVLVQLLQHRLEDQQLLLQVIDDQDVDLVGRFGHRTACACAQHSQPRSTASRCIGSTGLDR